jgi:uncharacterized membrane protein YhaH (DUF805 family)
MGREFFFGFDGRINRAKYWGVILLNFVCLMIFMPQGQQRAEPVRVRSAG